MVIFFLGDPSLQTLAWLGEMKTYLVAAAIAGFDTICCFSARRVIPALRQPHLLHRQHLLHRLLLLHSK